MSLEAILEEIRARGNTDLLDIEKHTETRVDQILGQAREEARDIKREVCEDIIAPARDEGSRLINEAQLKALRIRDEARQAAIAETLERVRARLAEVRDGDAYADLMRGLLRDAVEDLRITVGEDEDVHLQADERDERVVGEILEDYDQNVSASYDLEVWGGLVVRSRDGRVTVRNTLSSRLERAWPSLRRYLAAKFA